MADLISRAAAIDAIVGATVFPDEDYIKSLCQNPANSEDWLGGVCDAINAVEEVNAVDATPVVRCRDCKYWKDQSGTPKWLPCVENQTSGMWFCADGERREHEENSDTKRE